MVEVLGTFLMGSRASPQETTLGIFPRQSSGLRRFAHNLRPKDRKMKHARFEHATCKGTRRFQTRAYAVDNGIGAMTNPCSKASRIILMTMTQQSPAVQCRTSHSLETSEIPEIRIYIRKLLLLCFAYPCRTAIQVRRLSKSRNISGN